jgi:NAD(P)H-dependent FMN reductase
MNQSTRIGIVLGSTRPGRNGAAVAEWVQGLAAVRSDAHFELVDLADYHLPLLDEAMPPIMGQYANDHTRAWAETIANLDGYVLVTPEYNHSTSGALKNALDYLYAAWNNKAVGFVGYGVNGAARAVEHLRQVAGELQMADVRTAVGLELYVDFENYTTFKPRAQHEATVSAMLDQVVAWSGALATVRNG